LSADRSTVAVATAMIPGYAGNAIYASSGSLSLTDIYVSVATDAVSIISGAQAYITTSACSATGVTGSGMSLGAVCHVQQKGALAAFIGATSARAAYTCVAPAAAVNGTTWLAATGGSDTDLIGTWIVRKD
jgi:hypothetical protein